MFSAWIDDLALSLFETSVPQSEETRAELSQIAWATCQVVGSLSLPIGSNAILTHSNPLDYLAASK